MSIDVASLIFEIDSTQAVVARERLEALESVGGRVDVAARKVKTATQMAGIGMDGVAEGAKRATRAATEHADALGAVGKAALAAEREATRAAAREDAAWAKVAAAIEKRNAAYRGNVALTAMKSEAAAAASLEARIDRLQNSIDPTRAAQARLNGELQEAASLYKMGAISASDYAKAVGQLDQKMAQAARGHDAMIGTQGRAVGSTKALTQATLNLGRQAADIGVQAASGTPPLLILIQQGPQIADAFATAKTQGLGFTAVLRGMTASVAPLMAVLGPLVVAVGAIGAGFAIGAQQINASNKDLIDSLGLTEKQLEKVKNQSVTMGDVMKGTFNAAAKALSDAFNPEIDGVKSAFRAWYDELLVNTVNEMKTIVGAFIGAFEAIKATWKMLPAAMGDAAISAVNLTLTAMESMVNKAITMINGVIAGGNALAAKVGLNISAPLLNEQSFGRVTNQYEGALAKMAEAGTAAFQKGMAKGGKIVDSALGAITRETLQAYEERVRKEAGEAGKTPKGAAAPRDQTDERTAQIEAMIQAALADELQARLGVTREAEARADLERQIVRAQEAVKAAQLDRQAANIADDKGLTDAKKAELIGQIEIVRSINARAAAYRELAITENAADALAREVFSILQAEADLQLRVLSSQELVAKFEYERHAIGRDRLKIEQALEREALEQEVASQTATAAQKQIAQSLLNQLGAIQANEQEAFRLRAFERSVDETARAIDDIGDAIRDHDWGRVFTSLIKAVDQAVVAFATAKTSAERMSASGSLISAVGGAVGGKAGSAIGAIGSGFSAAGAAAGMAGSFGAIGGAIAGLAGPIGIAVAGFSLLSGILGDQKAKKRAKLEQEARDMENARTAALEEANRQAELQLRILELSGDEIGALTKRREAELATLKGASRALAEHVHALEDWVKAVDLAKDAVSKAQDDLRAAYEADKDRLNAIVAGVETARDRLNQAYQRERGVIEGTISSVRSLVDSLSAFRVEMDMMAAANDPSRQYGYASRQFATASNDNFVERGRAFAEASQSASATDLDFQRDLAAVRRRTDEASKTAQTQLTTAERQLLALDAMVIPLLGVNDNLISVEEAIRGLTTAEQMALLATEELARLDAQVGALIAINSSVLSVAQAISNLNGAISALASAQASKPAEASGATSQAVGLTGYVDKNADLAALYASGSGMAAGRTKEQFAAYHWERYGQGEGRTYTAFARGGYHMGGLRLVGEEGPELEATGPSRIYNARQTAQMLGGDTARLEALVETLTDKVEELTKLQRTDNFEIKRNTKDSADIMAKVTQGADTVRVKAA